MSKLSTTELALVKAISYNSPATKFSPGPGPSTSNPKAALKRCCAAWQRAFNAFEEGALGESIDHIFAAKDAGKAYCNAMPLLTGYEGVRDFIACAAQAALSILQFEPKPPKSRSA